MKAQELSREFNIDIKLVELLIIRGIDDSDSMKRFLMPLIDSLTDINNYKGAYAVSNRLKEAIKAENRILIYGDYDCDGICSVSMMYLFLKSLNANVSYYIPNRHSDGYGISLEAIIKLQELYRPDLIITVDCGSSSTKEIDYIQNKLGIEVIVTDHHILPIDLPQCIIFNPKLEDNAFKDLSGSGVVLRLIEAFSGRDEMIKYLDIASISTIADVVPLIEDNRVITALGIEMMRKNPRKGIKIIADIAKASYTASDIAFKIAPRINASGRLTDANKVVELFISEDYFMLQSIVREIDIDNQNRRKLSEQLYNDVLNMLDNYDLVNNKIVLLHKSSWDIGVLGIAASRIAREFKRPCILMTSHNELYKGSGRSIDGINIYDLLNTYKEKYVGFGGHSQAIGISFDGKFFNELISLINLDLERIEIPKLIDNSISIELSDIKIFKDLERLEPFGNGNPKPTFITKLKGKKFYSISNTEHIKAKIQDDIELIGFNMFDSMGVMNCGINAKIKLDLNISKYNGYGQGIINKIQYEPNNLDNEYFDALYVKQLLYKDYTKYKYKLINSLEEIYPSIYGQYGTLFIASKLNTCYNMIKDYDNLKFYINNKDNSNPENAIILSPASPNIARYYKRIVFVDKPLSLGYIDKFINENISDIFIIDNCINMNNISIDKDKFISIKDTIINCINIARYKSFDDLYSYVNKKAKCHYIHYSIVFYIMYEQGILLVDKGFKLKIINNDIRLEESNIYRRLND